MVVAAGAAVLVLVAGFYYLQTMNLSHAKDDLAAQESINSGIQAQIGDLTQFADLQTQLAAQKALVNTVFANEVSWSSALIDLSRVIPSNAYLTNLTGGLTALTGVAAAGGVPAPTSTEGTTTLIGDLSFTGVALEADTVASWLTRLEQVKGWANPWANTLQENGPRSRIYSFDSGIDLTSEAATPRGSGGSGSTP
jgi:Tfp pilus assembly protein PilN